jgi:hypothetical protein
MTGRGNPVREKAPEFIRRAFPRTWYHPRWHLLAWFPRGVLNEAFADQVIEFIEMEERIQEAPFDRRPIWTDSDPDRNRPYYSHCASAPQSETTGEVGILREQPGNLWRRPLVRIADPTQ